MKKILLCLISIFMFHAAYADNEAKLSIHIADPASNNKYFLCIYGVGCLSIKNGNKGVTVPITSMDMGDILKFVVTDVSTMKETMTPSNSSCNVKVNDGQTLTITGQLAVHNANATITNLHCHVA